MTDDPLLTVDDVASHLRSNPETIRRYLRSGRLRGVRPGGPRLGWRIAKSEVERFLREPRADYRTSIVKTEGQRPTAE